MTGYAADEKMTSNTTMKPLSGVLSKKPIFPISSCSFIRIISPLTELVQYNLLPAAERAKGLPRIYAVAEPPGIMKLHSDENLTWRE
jgi:hypothetical protein